MKSSPSLLREPFGRPAGLPERPRLKDRAESCYRTGERSLAKCDAPFNSLKCCVESALLAEPPKLRRVPFFLIRICSDKYLIRHVIE